MLTQTAAPTAAPARVATPLALEAEQVVRLEIVRQERTVRARVVSSTTYAGMGTGWTFEIMRGKRRRIFVYESDLEQIAPGEFLAFS